MKNSSCITHSISILLAFFPCRANVRPFQTSKQQWHESYINSKTKFSQTVRAKNAQSHFFIVPWQSKNTKNVPYLRRSARQKKNTTSEEVWAALFPAQHSIALTFSLTITRKMCSHQYLKFLRRRITSNLKRPSRYELFALLTQWKVMFFTISPRKWQNRRPGIKKSQTLRRSHSVIFFSSHLCM